MRFHRRLLCDDDCSLCVERKRLSELNRDRGAKLSRNETKTDTTFTANHRTRLCVLLCRPRSSSFLPRRRCSSGAPAYNRVDGVMSHTGLSRPQGGVTAGAQTTRGTPFLRGIFQKSDPKTSDNRPDDLEDRLSRSSTSPRGQTRKTPLQHDALQPMHLC